MAKKRQQAPKPTRKTRPRAAGSRRAPEKPGGSDPSLDALYVRVHAILTEARGRAWLAVNTAMVEA